MEFGDRPDLVAAGAGIGVGQFLGRIDRFVQEAQSMT
jgi:hypothetical protein